MESIFKLADLIKQNGRYALFLGAGCSYPTVPVSNEIINLLKDKYGSQIGSTFHDVMESAFNNPSDRRSFFEELCAGKTPSKHHYQIAELADKGKIDTIYTTNFDRLIEIAMMSCCTKQPSLFLNDVEFGGEELRGKHPTLLKLHGDFMLPSIANVPKELTEKMHIDMQKKLLSQWTNKGLIVIGYGGWDNTIMETFKMAIQTSDCLNGGLWWVNYECQNDPIAKLFAEASDSGKTCHYINCKASEFFDTLCENLSVDACQPHFGLRLDQNMPLSIGLPPMFVNAPHHIPALNREKPKGSTTLTSRSESNNLKRALATTEAIWLVGQWPVAFSSIIKSSRHKHRPIFYFDYRFSRNQPAFKDLNIAILRFAAGCGITTAGKYYLPLVQEIFCKSAILVFANISEADPYFCDEISRIYAIQNIAQKGNVVFMERSTPSEKFLRKVLTEIYAKAKSSNGIAYFPLGTCQRHDKEVTVLLNRGITIQAHHIGMQVIKSKALEINTSVSDNLNEDERQLLERIAMLRFGETCLTISALANKKNDRVQLLINSLESKGYLIQQGDRFHVSSTNWPDMSNGDSATIHLDIAKRFEKIAEDAPQQNDLQSLHYFLEAEFHFFSSHNYVKAATILAKISEDMLQIYSDTPRNYLWIAKRIHNFFNLESCGTPVISTMNEQHQLPLLLLRNSVYEAYDALSKKKIVATYEQLLNALSEPIKCYIHGYNFHSQKNYDEARVELEKLCDTEPSLLQGYAQMLIADCYFNMGQEKNTKYLAEQEYWTTKAFSNFETQKNRNCEAQALGNLGRIFLEKGNHIMAKNCLKIATINFQQEPGFSRDKGVVYGNLARALLLTSDAKEAEGFFLESMLHYTYIGELEGLTKLYFDLFKLRQQLPQECALTTEYLYNISVNIWKYCGCLPGLQSEMYLINNQYLAWALQEENATAIIKGINDMGCIAIKEPPNDRLQWASYWIQQFWATHDGISKRNTIRKGLRKSKYWSNQEKEHLLHIYKANQ
ncbi:SIR2 family protein [Chromobacterium haemolyticum]|uniref:SIR2 family protein n=1 Tax=Chromobacterium haemolyticum TaxID=394935 RepID=UPI001318BF18|nr:SIR2 family protein [Chromobacterium haemolyticum]BBH12894.1 hypothetical protein CH06BL_21420 [Chromobacterium haemolyticum]